ncbi:MAG: 3-dehydroquinate dehydratase [Saprospiraceae bacterium]|nr:3-dehydroquinate dehydratase [Saprospiraceae bacterium]
MKKIIIINGPNLNLLGKREVQIYGTQSFDDYFKVLQAKYRGQVDLTYFQSNHEGALIDKLHEVGFSYYAIILNGGAFSHTSLAMADALASIETPALEVHISNIHAREALREKSLTAARSVGCVTGLGLKSYDAGLDYFLSLDQP